MRHGVHQDTCEGRCRSGNVCTGDKYGLPCQSLVSLNLNDFPVPGISHTDMKVLKVVSNAQQEQTRTQHQAVTSSELPNNFGLVGE